MEIINVIEKAAGNVYGKVRERHIVGLHVFKFLMLNSIFPAENVVALQVDRRDIFLIFLMKTKAYSYRTADKVHHPERQIALLTMKNG